MKKNRTFHKKKIWVVFLCCILMMAGLIGRLVFLMCFRSDYYYEKAKDLHERERDIKAARGQILDAKGKVLASNRTVCTISVIHSQIKEPEKVIALLTEKLGMEEASVRKRVEKVSSIERVKTNVEKSVGDAIRECNLAGVKVDEDYKRYYPYGTLASKVIGFTGGDNQGIIGLEVKYEEILKGEPGKILTTTDARGVEIDKLGETRQEPVEGKSLLISLDANIQEFAQQAALKVMEEKQAERVSILLMNPQNGEIYACVNVPEFDLNEPFTLTDEMQRQLKEELQQTENSSGSRKKTEEQLKQELEADTDRLEAETDVDSKTIGQDETELPESKLEDESGNEVKAEDTVYLGKASLAEILTGMADPTEEEIRAAEIENAKPVKQKAKEKLEAEKKKATQKNFADPIIAYLLKRCEEDQGCDAGGKDLEQVL